MGLEGDSYSITLLFYISEFIDHKCSLRYLEILFSSQITHYKIVLIEGKDDMRKKMISFLSCSLYWQLSCAVTLEELKTSADSVGCQLCQM